MAGFTRMDRARAERNAQRASEETLLNAIEGWKELIKEHEADIKALKHKLEINPNYGKWDIERVNDQIKVLRGMKASCNGKIKVYQAELERREAIGVAEANRIFAEA